MSRRTAATIGGVVAATMLIAGIAWASGADDAPTSTTNPSAQTSLDDNSSSSRADGSISTGLNGQTSTTVEDRTSSSSANSSTSTTIDDNESSTVDDDDDNSGRGGDDDIDDDNSGKGGDDDIDDDNSGKGGDDDIDDDNSDRGGDDDDDAVVVADGIHTFDVAGVAQVTLNVVSGQMQLADVQAGAGWTVEVDQARADQIKVKFRNGEREAEFEAELEHGGLKIEVEAGS
jgi:hypothetical protein